jgi:hypothetical protein
MEEKLVMRNIANKLFKIFLLIGLSSQANGESFKNFSIENVRPEYIRTNEKSNEIEFFEYLAETPPTVVIGPGVSSCKFEKQKCHEGQRIALNLPVPFHPQTWSLQFVAEGKFQKHKFRALPRNAPPFSVFGKSAIPNQDLVFATRDLFLNDSCHLFVVRPNGELRFYRQTKPICIDFRPHLIEGRTLYSYGAASEGVIDGVAMMGSRQILDERFHEVDRIDGNFDHHEFHYYGKGHYLGIQILQKRLPNGLSYLDKRIREYENGKIIFDWGISDFFDQVKSSMTAVAYASSLNGQVVWELVHLNAIQLLKNGDFILSLGDSGVIYLNRKTKKVDWILGGPYDEFGLTFQQYPQFQHTTWFDVETNRLLLFSNRNIGSPHGVSFSRLLEYELDTKGKKLIKLNVLRDKKESIMAMGAVQRVGSVYSLTFGRKTIGSDDYYSEMKDDKDIFGFRFGEEKQWFLYRVYRGL